MSENFLALVEDKSELDPVSYQYFKNYCNYRTIVFNRSIDENIVEMVILPLLEFERDDNPNPVKLVLSTTGGSVGDSLVLCNIIDNYKKPLEIYVYGYACSMGTIILCAGNNNPNVTKYCYPFSFGLFHSGYTVVEGESSSVEDEIAFNRRLDDRIKQYICKNTKITEEEYKANERRQWYLDAHEMKEKGLIDIIIGEDDNTNE